MVEDAAHAVEPAQPCPLGQLLDAGGAILDGPLITTPSAAPAGSPAHGQPALAGAEVTVANLGQPLTVVATPARTPTGKPLAGAEAHRAEDAAAAPGVARDAEALIPVTRPVVDLASPLVEKIAETRLLEPVGEVVWPVAEPIVDVLPPALAPVLELTQPIIGAPAAPPASPGAPVDGAPTPVRGASTAATPAAIVRPTLPVVAVDPQAPSPEVPSKLAGRDEVPAGVGEVVQVPWPGDPRGTAGETPAAPASTAGTGSAVPGTGIPVDASPRSWSPDLHLVGSRLCQCDKLAHRSSQPDTRPA
ncbi:hypothetical protein FXF52_13135 [Micromonospora sp. MP36]|nr:hypothetical protein FXF52_13135 [Micromonospora sp. MP36]